MSGFVTLHREALDHHLFRGDSARLGAWFWLIGKACWKPTTHDARGRTITVERGQLCAGREYLAKEWGWSPSAVERFLVRLETEHMIERQTGQGKSVITICNYDKYQDVAAEGGHMSGQSTEQKSDRNRTAKEQGNKETREPNGSHTPLSPRSDFEAYPEPAPAPTADNRGEVEASPAAAKFGPQDVLDMWNRAAVQIGLPKATKLSDARRKHATRLIRDHGEEGFRTAIRAIIRSRFLRGDNDTGWRADVDFLLQPKSFLKLIEGAYDRSNRARSDYRHEPDGAVAFLQQRLGIDGDPGPPGEAGRWDDRETGGSDLVPRRSA
ncbi:MULTISPECIES: hypothetical protein [unclassified Novosphingobium]|uniref:hypothetical protein n=1 Tax=unclassified Novosphingobium TaxID=2644732 RepID=UPI000D3D72F9|nr:MULTISPECIES: hypothetical protein [unclassified Novosphingobium]